MVGTPIAEREAYQALLAAQLKAAESAVGMQAAAAQDRPFVAGLNQDRRNSAKHGVVTVDTEIVRRATTRRKMVNAQRTADGRSQQMRETARDLRVRASAILDPINRQTMLRSAVDHERRANHLDGEAEANMENADR
jgi:hypothetical protein